MASITAAFVSQPSVSTLCLWASMQRAMRLLPSSNERCSPVGAIGAGVACLQEERTGDERASVGVRGGQPVGGTITAGYVLRERCAVYAPCLAPEGSVCCVLSRNTLSVGGCCQSSVQFSYMFFSASGTVRAQINCARARGSGAQRRAMSTSLSQNGTYMWYFGVAIVLKKPHLVADYKREGGVVGGKGGTAGVQHS